MDVVRRVAGPGADRGRPRLCFFSFNGVHLYRRDGGGLVGGAEMQYRLLARHLSRRFDVHLVTIDPGAEVALDVPEGHTLHLVGEGPGDRRVRFLRRMRGFRQALRDTKADAFLQRGAGFVTFLVAWHARRAGRPFVFHWASDDDLTGSRMQEFPGVGPLYRKGRAMADLQVCQTEHQLSLLPPTQRSKAIVLPNVLDDSVSWTTAPDSPTHRKEVLWLGSIKPQAKRPDRLLDLAAALPHRTFRFVGDLRGDATFQATFKQRLSALPNVSWAGFVRRDGLPAGFARARVNTSDFEGFPNTFLEACASGVPIVSLNVDPNGMLAKHGAGRFLAGDEAALPQAVESLFDDQAWHRARKACAAVAAAHRPEAGADRLADALARLGVKVPAEGA